jgi:predicted permease
MTKLLTSLAIIAFSLALGYLLQQLVARGRLQLPLALADLRKALQRIALLAILPLTMTAAIWVVEVHTISIAALPVIGAGAIILGGLLALAGARLLRLPPRQTGALVPCGSFINLGAIGALVCYFYLGEAGFALVPIYKLLEEFTYYTMGFPLAKYYSTADGAVDSTAERLGALAKDPFILVTVTSIILGIGLNLSGLARPSFFAPLNAVFIPLGTGLLLVSIGLALRFSRMRRYAGPCALVVGIKFVAVPLAAVSVAHFLGYGAIDHGLPLKVVLILSAMPVAFTALIPPSIYDLDLDLANACWFTTTSALVVVLPLLLFVTNQMG